MGECGLDYYYEHSPRDAQRRAFAEQIALAGDHDLALVIHTRDAWPETFDILGAEGVPERTVFHCFTGGPEEARRCLDLGAWLSFSGIVTFKAAADLREAAALCPLDRMLVETDSPYLAPVPHRGIDQYAANPGYYGDHYTIDEKELIKLRDAGDWGNFVSYSDQVGEATEYLTQRYLDRAEKKRKQVLTGGGAPEFRGPA